MIITMNNDDGDDDDDNDDNDDSDTVRGPRNGETSC